MNKEVLQDAFGRFHDYLRISLTEKCNLRCTYCMPSEGTPLLPSSKLMQADEVIQIAKGFVIGGVKKIRLTGGEPLVRKDFRQILKGLAELPVELAISTNGILVDKYLDLFKEVGLNKINLSLDSLNAEKFKHITRRDHFDTVIKNMHLLLEEGFEVKVNVVVMKGFNEDEIIPFIDLTKDLNVSVRFIEFMPFDGNDWSSDKMVSLQEILSLANESYSENLKKIKDDLHDTTKHYQVKGYAGNWGVISTVTAPFCSGCNRLRLTADGKMKNCLFDNNEADILGAIRNGESIEPLVATAVGRKKAIRGGMDNDEKLQDEKYNQDNRSMIAIGG